jgi:putative flippase GtrA
MTSLSGRRREGLLIGGHISVSLFGFIVDAIILTTSMGSGLHAAEARLISLFWAMQATFVLNGLFVFRKLTIKRLPGQWGRYMACNGVGNLVNYLAFVGLVATGWPVASNRYVALCLAAFTAWIINYAGARFWTFGRRRAGSVPHLDEQVPELPRLGPQVLRRRLHLGPEVGGRMPGPVRVVEQPPGQGDEVGVAGP